MNLKETFKDVLPLLEKFSPTIGATIGGPLGMAAGYILPILGSAFGASPADLNKLASTILQDPAVQDKLTQLEKDHGDSLNALSIGRIPLSTMEINIKLGWQNGVS